jgi:hypothetical protein
MHDDHAHDHSVLHGLCRPSLLPLLQLTTVSVLEELLLLLLLLAYLRLSTLLHACAVSQTVPGQT